MASSLLDKVVATDAENAYRLIKRKIITLEFPPGSPINQHELMAELGVSRTPVREALKRLEHESLIVAVHRRGMSVAQIALNDLRHVFEIRFDLEAACARLAASRATVEQIQRLKELSEELRNTDPHDRHLVADQERKLHFLIAECGHNPFLIKEAQHYYALALRIWYFLIDRLPSRSEIIDFHDQLVDAIEARDSERAEQLMRDHVKSVFDLVKAYL